jgi:hypothetical protein
MNRTLDEIASKAGNALWILGLCASIFLAQLLLKASVVEILTGLGIAFSIYALAVIADANLNNRAASQFPWLYSLSEKGIGNSLGAVEFRAQAGSTVYLVSPDLHNDAWNTSTIKCVSKNLKRGVQYAYLTRDDDSTSRKNIDVIHQNFKEDSGNLSIFVANELFSSLPTYNILVIERDVTGQLRVFVELPVTESLKTESPRAFWVEAEPRFADRWHQRVLDSLKNRPAEHNPFSGASTQAQPESSLKLASNG